MGSPAQIGWALYRMIWQSATVCLLILWWRVSYLVAIIATCHLRIVEVIPLFLVPCLAILLRLNILRIWPRFLMLPHMVKSRRTRYQKVHQFLSWWCDDQHLKVPCNFASHMLDTRLSCFIADATLNLKMGRARGWGNCPHTSGKSQIFSMLTE